EDRQPLTMFVGTNTGQSFQHFITGYPNTTFRSSHLRYYGAPNGVSMQNRASMGGTRDRNVQRYFSRGATSAFQHLAGFVHNHDLLGRKTSFIQSSTSDRQP